MTRILIIAEAGVNHNGSVDLAIQLIDAAADAGADVVKFQTYRTESLVTRAAEKADYQKLASPGNESQFEMLSRLELSEKDHFLLLNHANHRGIRFLSTAFDLPSLTFLHSLGMRTFKVPSGEITNPLYLRKVAKFAEEVIMSTGMADLGEIGWALGQLEGAGLRRDKIVVLHCTSAYPCPFDQVHLRAMLSIGKTFGCKIGYSDHTEGIIVPIAAAALGATIIEKHFTLDKKLPGPDHKMSLEPEELRNMIVAIRTVETALGQDTKAPTPIEVKTKSVARKRIVASRPIEKGELLSEENLTVKRSSAGLEAHEWDSLIGRRVSVGIPADAPVNFSDLEK